MAPQERKPLKKNPDQRSPRQSVADFSKLMQDIHTAFFQRKRHFFPAAQTPTGSTFRSDSSVSVGPTVRTYTRNVPILRTFFITEFREPGAPQNLVKKNVKSFQWKSQRFPVEKSNFSSGKAKLFQWKSQTFPAEKSNWKMQGCAYRFLALA